MVMVMVVVMVVSVVRGVWCKWRGWSRAEPIKQRFYSC